MKNKKGVEFIGGHTINILIAILVLIVLVYLGVQLYNLILKQDEKLKYAENTLELIIDVINAVEDKADKVILNPEAWYLLYFDSQKPKQCGNRNCLCICENNGAEGCNKKGVCKNMDKEIELGTDLGYVSFRDVPLTLVFINEEGVIKINREESEDTQRILEELLEKQVYSDKNLREFILDYVDEEDEKKKTEKRKKIIGFIDNYLENIDLLSLFGLKLEEISWSFQVREYKDVDPIFYLRYFREGYDSHKMISSSVLKLDENKIIELYFYEGELSSSGRIGVSDGP